MVGPAVVGAAVGAAVVDALVGTAVVAEVDGVSAGAKAGAGGGGGGSGVGRLQLFVTSLQRNVHLGILFEAPKASKVMCCKKMDISLVLNCIDIHLKVSKLVISSPITTYNHIPNFRNMPNNSLKDKPISNIMI